MSADARTVMIAMRDALRTNHAHVDLSTSSGTPRVVVAEPSTTPPIGAPYVYLGPPTIRPSYQADMGHYMVEYVSDWAGIASADSLTPEERALDALDLADDVVTALQDAHQDAANATLHGLLWLLPEVTDVLGAGTIQGVDYGLALGRITWRTVLERGA